MAVEYSVVVSAACHFNTCEYKVGLDEFFPFVRAAAVCNRLQGKRFGFEEGHLRWSRFYACSPCNGRYLSCLKTVVGCTIQHM